MQVLIVDDDIATVDLIAHSVQWERLGVREVYTAYNVNVAKEILLREDIDIVVSDIEMPQGSGIDLLEWYREQGLPGKFLLLTCHERFDYATSAIRYDASEYLLKPFDVGVMEAALQKVIQRIKEERQLTEASEYGEWAQNNAGRLQTAFLNEVLTGHIAEDRTAIREEIDKRMLSIDPDSDYVLVVSRITEMQRDRDKMNTDLMMFIAENMHSEILCGSPDNSAVVSMNYEDYLVLATVCNGVTQEEMRERCAQLQESYGQYLTARMTICIGRPCAIEELRSCYHRIRGRIEENVAYYGSCFLEDEGASGPADAQGVLDSKRLEQYLADRNKVAFLGNLKSTFRDRMSERSLTDAVLRRGKEEILQAVYLYLGKKDIQASGIFTDQDLVSLGERATQSVLDMIRWANYLVDCTFAYEERVQNNYSLSERIDQYIAEHYRERIGRTEIAEQFYLAPEYLSKVYTKQTGKYIKDTIAEYRIEEAKRLLARGERVSDVAEQVGYDNFTYFSTTFKKYTGVTPNQYRRK